MISTKVSVDIEINNYATRTGDSNFLLLYRAFCVLKELDDGTGKIEINLAEKAIQLHIGKSYTFAVLSRIEGNIFWTLSATDVYLSGWNKVYQKLNITPTKVVDVPTHLFKGIANFASYVYAAWLDGKTISREKIEEVTGIPKTTQRRYERKQNIVVKNNCFVLTKEQAVEFCAGGNVKVGTMPVTQNNVNALSERKDGDYNLQTANTYLSGKVAYVKNRIKRFLKDLGHNQEIGRGKDFILFVSEHFQKVSNAGRIEITRLKVKDGYKSLIQLQPDKYSYKMNIFTPMGATCSY